MSDSEHVHDYQPVPLECGLYACACGRTAYKASYGPDKGKLVPHKRTRDIPTTPTAQPVGKEFAQSPIGVYTSASSLGCRRTPARKPRP